MQRSLLTGSLVLGSLLLTGAGCLSLGGSSTTTEGGGLWQSADAGATWNHAVAFPQASGVGTLGNVDVTNIEIDPSDTGTYYLSTLANGIFVSEDAGVSWRRPGNEPLIRTGPVLGVEVDSRNVCTFYVAKTDRIMKTTTCGRDFNTEAYVETRTDESITTMVVDWYNSDIIWLGTTAGDLIRSTDGGVTWGTVKRLGDAVVAIELSNADSRVVLVGTKSKSIFRSTDSGVTWEEFEKTLKTDFKSSDVVYGFSQDKTGGTIVVNTKYGLLVSKDQGATWTAIPLITGVAEVRIRDVAVAPENGDVIMYGTDSTFYVSTSGGAAWATTELPGRSVGALLIHPDSAKQILLGARSYTE